MNVYKLRLISSSLLFSLLIALFPLSVSAESDLPEIQAGSYIIMEFESGVILAESRADDPLAPASMTKMMTEYIVLEKIKAGKISWDDMITVSSNAASLAEAQVYLKAGKGEL